ncbi:M20/M25/M40 family metallo-hydrolase [Cytobacillus purgationiresistens]|uniref:Arginine utilization protein RocB n=1 Tax=Cytobacillus purgationiresistens TaxID=863449 RepID=A0ABU0APB5_9BACI|nr:M20/M25/M40 family metallo-hydrolase [Cytobacillus purgationiresistens]MDQ0273133.1 arginine utilization protein RocB [Cytobacillus purgationiresistens]
MEDAMFMQSADQMLSTLIDLVSIDSVSLSAGEKYFPLRTEQVLRGIPYFQENSELIKNHPTSDGRSILTALYKHENAVKTVVMISHFDVVDIEDYGELKHLAFNPIELTNALHHRTEGLPDDARDDLQSGDWLFGRGMMDMKCGLVQHMSLLEKASFENWEINLLLVTVPDEEVNSVGMREIIPKLVEMADEHQLTYTLYLNSEPMFSQVPQDEQRYFYTGTIGKIMPGALCFGKESHVGEPFSGMNACWMSSVLTQEVEWNEGLCETVNGVMSPPPTLLLQRDMKKEYSTQIPHRSVSLFNLLLMKRNAADVMEEMKEVASKAAHKMESFIEEKYKLNNLDRSQLSNIQVLFYEELRNYAIEKTSDEYIDKMEQAIANETDGDIREQTIQIVDQMAMLCQELGPMIVLFYAPPYYPAVDSGPESMIQEISASLIEFACDRCGEELKATDYFNGISDLSYAGLHADLSEMDKYNVNLPGGEKLYSIPFKQMAKITAPVINVGPLGKDAHQKTERLHVPFAFEKLPKILEHLIKIHEKQADRF